jgi:5'-nucleotidase
MAFPIENKLVIAIASSALFDLTESDAIFKSQGEDKYRQYQNKNINRQSLSHSLNVCCH